MNVTINNKIIVYKKNDDGRCFCFLNEKHYFDILLNSEFWLLAEHRAKEEFGYNRLEEINNNPSQYSSIDFVHFEAHLKKIIERGVDTICSPPVIGKCYKSKMNDFGNFSFDFFKLDEFERFSFHPLRSVFLESDDEIETVVEMERKISFGIGPKIEKQLDQVLVFSDETEVKEMKVEFEEFITSINSLFETLITPPFPILTRKIEGEEDDE